MGRARRERIQRIHEGTEIPIAFKMRLGASSPSAALKESVAFCYACHANVLSSEVYNHIRGCWKVEIKDGDVIPRMPPVEVLIKRHQEAGVAYLAQELEYLKKHVLVVK
jgi:hypothetical protein